MWAYIRLAEVPCNALHDQFYPSIGCAPARAPSRVGEDARRTLVVGNRRRKEPPRQGELSH